MAFWSLTSQRNWILSAPYCMIPGCCESGITYFKIIWGSWVTIVGGSWHHPWLHQISGSRGRGGQSAVDTSSDSAPSGRVQGCGGVRSGARCRYQCQASHHITGCGGRPISPDTTTSVSTLNDVSACHWRLGAELAPCGPDTPELYSVENGWRPHISQDESAWQYKSPHGLNLFYNCFIHFNVSTK